MWGAARPRPEDPEAVNRDPTGSQEPMTKTQLEDRIKKLEGELAERVTKLEALSQACNARFIHYDGGSYVALPLTKEEDEAVRTTIEDSCCKLLGEGDLLSGSYEGGEATYGISLDSTGSSLHARLLPQWDGYFVIYNYSRDDGTYGHHIWGLKRTKVSGS
jgi:hypothetical protein